MLPMEAPGISVRDLAEGRWQLILPAAHPLAARGSIHLTDLADEPLLMFAKTMNPALYDFVLGRFRRSGVEPNVVYETSQVEAGQNMVALGVGLWVVTTYVIQGRFLEGLVARVLADFDVIRLGLAWRTADTSPGVRALLDAARYSGGS
nr:LysR family substrate-binding domain-containing protein [Deinococcus aestuarii]